MAVYKCAFKNPVQKIVAKNEDEAREIFWENFDTYNEGYPDSDDLVCEKVK